MDKEENVSRDKVVDVDKTNEMRTSEMKYEGIEGKGEHTKLKTQENVFSVSTFVSQIKSHTT